jgi:signal transduction histidine kinase
VREASRRLRDGHEIVEAEGRVIRADGQALWLEVNARPIPDEQVFYAAARDVTDRHIAEETLREAQRLIEASRDELRVLADEQAALRRVATLVARGGSPSAVFAAVAEEVGHVMHDAAHAFVGRYHGDVAMEVVGAWSRTGDSGIRGSHTNLGGRNVSTLVFKSKRPARVDHFPQDDESAVTVAARAVGSRSSAGAPIIVEGQLWGLMIVTSTREDTLPAGTEHRLAEFTELAATAIANTQAQAELTASRARIVTTADETRRRIVRDLHDGAQQRLVQAIVTLNLAQHALNEGDESGRGLVVEALAQAKLANAELRELAHGILPNVLTRGGLSAGVETLVSRLRVPVTVNVVHERFPSGVEATAYFVVAEALTNVAKHANAESVHVAASVDDRVLHVEVFDDGVGGARPDGHGLLGLDDRVNALGGVLRIESPPDGGTRIAATLPLQG